MSHKVEQWIEAGEYRQAIKSLEASTTPDDIALLAWAKLESGDTEGALRTCEALAKQKLSPTSQARRLAVFGRATARLGRTVEGLAALKRAIAISAAHNPLLEADIRAQQVTAALNWIGLEPVLADLPQLRRAALESANRDALAEYHIVYARVAALRGWWRTSKKELAAARALMSTSPHVARRWRLAQTSASIAILAGELDDALNQAKEGLALANETGSRSKKASTLANLAYIESAAGHFDAARTLLAQADSMLETNSQIKFATLGTGINIGLRTGDDAFARAMFERAEGLQGLTPEASYYQVSFALQRTLWFIYAQQFDTAIEIAEKALESARKLADVDLCERIKLLRIDALIGTGRMPDATSALDELLHTNSQQTVEVLAEIERVSALLFAPFNGDWSRDALSRAERLLASSGLLGSVRDVRKTADRVVTAGPPKAATDFLQDARHLATLLRLGRYPKVLAEEVLFCFEKSGLCTGGVVNERTGAKLREVGRFGSGGASASGVVVHDIDRTYEVHATGADATSLLALRSALQQFAVAARAIVAAAGDAEPPAPWPFEGAEQRDGMIVSAESTSELLSTAKRIAPSNITVLITGETGTGKELFARVLHDASPRSAKPFIPFNCSAVSKEMLDAQLFGYRKGAFTGATSEFAGVIRGAAGGTLFLDEIGEVALDVQPKLLRFLESGEVHPLGEPRPIAVDVRVVAATNANLEQMVDEGRFREDLFYRLNVVRLQVPPLRERREEIPPLVHHYLDRWSREAHKTGLRLADETMEYLILYKWPGNVRQLANELRRMVALAESNAVLMPEHLSHEIAASRRTVPASERTLAPTEFVVRMDQPMSAAMEHLERSMIQYALKLSGGRVEEAAERLGLSRKGLYLKRQRLAIQDANADAQAALSA